jgi:TolA-binding protein
MAKMQVQHNLQANLAQRVGSLPVDPRLSTGTQVKGANIAIPGFMQKQISALEKELEKSNDEINQIQCQQGELEIKLQNNPELADEINPQRQALAQQARMIESRIANLQVTIDNLKTNIEKSDPDKELQKEKSDYLKSIGAEMLRQAQPPKNPLELLQ